MLAGQGETSRLQRQVKRAGRLVNEVNAYAYTPLDPGLFGAGHDAAPGAGPRGAHRIAARAGPAGRRSTHRGGAGHAQGAGRERGRLRAGDGAGPGAQARARRDLAGRLRGRGAVPRPGGGPDPRGGVAGGAAVPRPSTPRWSPACCPRGPARARSDVHAALDEARARSGQHHAGPALDALRGRRPPRAAGLGRRERPGGGGDAARGRDGARPRGAGGAAGGDAGRLPRRRCATRPSATTGSPPCWPGCSPGAPTRWAPRRSST